jgi:hypothetical protein
VLGGSLALTAYVPPGAAAKAALVREQALLVGHGADRRGHRRKVGRARRRRYGNHSDDFALLAEHLIFRCRPRTAGTGRPIQLAKEPVSRRQLLHRAVRDDCPMYQIGRKILQIRHGSYGRDHGRHFRVRRRVCEVERLILALPEGEDRK